MAIDSSLDNKSPDILRSNPQDQLALVLEASSPRSADTAKTLASLGSHLALHCRPDAKASAIALFHGLSSSNPGIRITVHTSNLSSPADMNTLFADVLAKHGKIDVVVNGMGEILQKPIAQLSEAEREQLLAYTAFVGEQGQDYSKQLREELGKRRQGS